MDDIKSAMDIKRAMEAKKNAFKHKCYEAYELRWMIAHGNTLQEFVDTLGDIAAESVEEDAMCAVTDGESAKSLIADAHDAFVADVGFCGSLWADFDEFIQTEFRDPVYMMKLLEVMYPHGTTWNSYEAMWNFYCEFFLKE